MNDKYPPLTNDHFDFIERATTGTDPFEAGWHVKEITIGRITIKDASAKGRAATLDFLEVLRQCRHESDHRCRQGATKPLRRLPPGPRRALSAEIASHLTDCKRRGNTPSSISSKSFTLDFLLLAAGDIAVADITREHIQAMWSAIEVCPRNPRSQVRFKGMDLAQIVEIGRREGGEPPSGGTMNVHWANLRFFFEKLDAAGTIVDSPLKGLDYRQKTAVDTSVRRLFSREELQKIFTPENFLPWAKLPHKWWVPMLALFTGCRVGELSQLKVHDVIEHYGVPSLTVRATDKNDELKTASSRRVILLAPALLEAGFLDFVDDMKEAGEHRLFPHVHRPKSRVTGKESCSGNGRQVSELFANYAKTLGLDRCMHSFRHTFITTMHGMRVPNDVTASITGHSNTSEKAFGALGNYQHKDAVRQTLFDQAQEALARFDPGVTLVRYEKGQFADAIAELRKQGGQKHA